MDTVADAVTAGGGPGRPADRVLGILVSPNSGLSKDVILETISGLLEAADARFEDEPGIEEALFIWKDTTADFADCLIGVRNRRLGCRATATFDTKASRLPGFMAAS